MVFERRAEHQSQRGLGAVQRLETRAAEQAVINNRPPQQDSEFGSGVDAAAPQAATQGVEILGLLADQQRLRFTIAMLLAQIVTNGGTSKVPDKTCRAEAEALLVSK